MSIFRIHMKVSKEIKSRIVKRHEKNLLSTFFFFFFPAWFKPIKIYYVLKFNLDV